ncbi:nuclear transport factor 2 family protein [Flavobacterium cerinum]|uniref:Nuclear transport factor 2 family protein n=1 Tax=Flavobacterium cerinum TaxID=2502784 RepID=A0ABY5IUM6_9FLAO|nr:nuclear transport factor 2 family protein [Flavobacterium cerinum]UUC45171.1 nuclear transport factor 2 family protein [Flavobacterium cerinum]
MTQKEMAQDFLQLAAKGKAKEAFQYYIGSDFIHHNAFFKGDGTTLMHAMDENARNNPDKVFEIQRALEDNDLVAVHSRVRQTPDDTGAAVIHIFRFYNDKIVELWDFGQAVPNTMINENGMF